MSSLPLLPEAVLGQYRHYKGGLYEVIGVARHSESLEPLVVYRPKYGERGLWVRPFTMFFESVVHDGRAQPRFALVGKASPPDQAELESTVQRMEAALALATEPVVALSLACYRQLLPRFEAELGANSRDAWLARASALMLVQALHQAHGAA